MRTREREKTLRFTSGWRSVSHTPSDSLVPSALCAVVTGGAGLSEAKMADFEGRVSDEEKVGSYQAVTGYFGSGRKRIDVLAMY